MDEERAARDSLTDEVVVENRFVVPVDAKIPNLASGLNFMEGKAVTQRIQNRQPKKLRTRSEHVRDPVHQRCGSDFDGSCQCDVDRDR